MNLELTGSGQLASWIPCVCLAPTLQALLVLNIDYDDLNGDLKCYPHACVTRLYPQGLLASPLI